LPDQRREPERKKLCALASLGARITEKDAQEGRR